jgi:hypothetical protein
MYTAEIHAAKLGDTTDSPLELFQPSARHQWRSIVAFRLNYKTVAALCAVHDSPLNQGTAQLFN